MNKKNLILGSMAVLAFATSMGLSACSGADGSDGAQGVAGVDGKDGVDGKEGASCTATALKDDSGYVLSCGGEVVGSILNGKDGAQGIAGADGKSCSAAPNADASGYDISCDGKVVGTILNGTNGVDGNDGADGESCSATALVDGSGFTLTCGDKKVGVIKNGVDGADGKDGVDGTSCSAALNAAKTGYTLTCGGKVVGTILNGTNGIDGVDGSDGADGVSCSATALVDGSGFTLVCGGKKVGVIKNGVDGVDGIDGTDGKDGVDGTSCSATALEDGSGFTLICGDEEIGVIKNGTDASSTKVVYTLSMMVTSNMTEYVVSSKGVISAGVVASASKGSGDFKTWLGVGDSRYKVVTGLDDGSGLSGLWFSYTDKANHGTSKFTWPVALANDNLAPVIDACGGMCGSVEMGPGYDFPFAGFGFHIKNADRLDGADITAWNGLCIAYAAGGTEGLSISAELTPSDEGNYTAFNNYTYKLPLNGARIINIPWSAFTQATGWGKTVDEAEFLKRVTSIRFAFAGAAGESGYFSVQRIGMYGQCGN